jgi:hypothetical protein
MMKKYFQFDNIIRNGHFSPFMDMRKFIKNLVSLKWPSTGRFTYHNLRNGKVLWSYTIEGVSFSNEKSNPGRGKYLRHRKILAMFVKHLLHEACGTGTRESKKFLLWLCCSPKGTVGESVWHFLTKGDKEVRMWEAEQVARVYDPNYKPEDHIGWDNTDASIPILIKSEMKYGEVDDIPAAFKRKVAWYTPSNTF